MNDNLWGFKIPDSFFETQRILQNMTSTFEAWNRISQGLAYAHNIKGAFAMVDSMQTALKSSVPTEAITGLTTSVRAMQTVLESSKIIISTPVIPSIERILPIIDTTWKVPAIDWDWVCESIATYENGIDQNELECLLTEDVCEELEESVQEIVTASNSDEVAKSKFLEWQNRHPVLAFLFIQILLALLIHGDASVTDDLILGHRGDGWYPEWDPNNPDEDIRLLEAGSIMHDHFEDTRKQIEAIIQLHKSFFETCDQYDEIYILGLSYNETDRMYIVEIAKYNKKAKWFFNWYSKEDFDYIEKYARSLSIAPDRCKKINIDQLHT